MDRSPDPADLLMQADRLQRLARSLVHDRSSADDLVQEAFLAAVRRPPRNPEKLPGWLHAVVRRLSLRERRDEGRRRRRERLAARRELALGGAPEVVERAEMHQRLIGEVLKLDEPFRSTVLRRYFEEKSHREIAALDRIPPSTARWRLAEGLRRLRARLDRLHGGDRSAWMVSLAPLADPGPVRVAFGGAGGAQGGGAALHGGQPFTLGVALMTKKAALISLAASLVALAIGIAVGRGLAPGVGGEEPARPAPLEGRPGGPSRADRDLGGLRAAFAQQRTAFEARISALEAELAAARKSADPQSQEDPDSKILEEAARNLITERLDPEYLWRATHEAGDLDGMEQYLALAEAIYRLRLSRSDLSEEERRRIEQHFDYLGFRKGYTRLARGDAARAREDLLEHIESIDLEEKELKAAGGSLAPASAVYRTRSRDVLGAIDAIIGRPPPAEPDLRAYWATEKRANFQTLRGRAVGIVFRNANEPRSADFLGPLSRLYEGNPGVEILSVSFLKADRSAEEQVSDLRQELERIGFKGAAGFDPDPVQKSLFRRFRANVGSATFYILNPAGNVVWFMQDPRGIDVHFARNLLDRASGR